MAGYDYDVVILGGGPGGYVAGIRAGQLGLKAAVIERDKVGGVCVNEGCIPSKALIHQAELFRSIPSLKEIGLSVDTKGFDYKAVFDKSRKASDALMKGVQFLLKKNKAVTIPAEGTLSGRNEITLKDGKKITGKNIVIATGSRPRVIPGFEFDEERVLSSTGAIMLTKLPKKAIILGAGAIGVEFAHIFNAFGVEVHLVEMLDRILPIEDAEAVKVLARAFQKRGVQMYTGTKAVSVQKTAGGVSVVLEDKGGARKAVDADQILVVVGRTPNTDGIGLEKVGITTEKGFIPVGDFNQTKVSGIYAIGDVVNTPLLAHVAFKEAEIAIEHMAGKSPEPRIDPLSIPSATYCEPQVASFGLPEWKAVEQKLSFAKASFPYRGAGKSVALEQTEGFVKVIYEPKTKEILGVHIVGADATEIMHEMLLGRTAELLPEDIALMIHAHPTLSEAVGEAMRAVEGWAIHV
ncbi:MAG TPA: dihydrolipoyl dehydrogenase [Spirochaetia bacterium]|nr:dihydrolipoyl dehydrogenase [Spirochaetia bacterium]